ncbi:MAG: hypothetical protein ACRC80_09780 [Waterburya sp.]
MSFSERDLKKKLEEMEAEINQKTAATSSESNQKSVFPEFELNPSPQVQSWINTSRTWFNSLPKVGKAAVALGTVWLGFSILGAIVHVVSSLVSVAIVGLILYVGYRWFNKSSD